MPQPNDLTTLQWLAPSLARDGLVRNEDWVLPAWNEAAGLFDDPTLHLPARFLAILHRFALDYIRQAPALVIAATHAKHLLRREDRLVAGKRFLAHCDSGLRLAQLAQAYGLAPQLRVLSGKALRGHHLDLLTALSPIPASALAQSIPKDPAEQREWIAALERWRMQMARHAHDRNLFLEWAATNLRDAPARRAAGDLADFAGRNRAEFNPSWNLAQAQAASARWHEELARRPFGAAAQRADWTTVIDYAPFPSTAEVEGFAFHALQTREAIYDEGARMHHCVRMYADKVARGGSRIFSVRHAGQRIATLELVRTSRAGASQTRYAFSQFKGPHNSRPAAPAVQAVSAFMAQYCAETHATVQGAGGTVGQTRLQRAIRDIAMVRAPNVGPRLPAQHHPIDAAALGGRSRVLLRHRLGDEVYSTWFHHMQFGGFEGGTLRITFPTRFLRNWVQAHYLNAVRDACAGEFAGLARIEFEVRQHVPMDAPVRAQVGASTPPATPPEPVRPDEGTACAVREVTDGGAPPRVRIDAIIAAVARRYAVTRTDLLSQRRHPSIVWPRQVAMYLSRYLTNRSLPEIGRRMGGRDHTTVLHAIRKIEEHRTANPLFRAELEELVRALSDGDRDQVGEQGDELRV